LQLAASDQMRRDDARPGDPAHENVHRFLTAFAQQLVATASHQ
jgi:hypothetical protein